MDSHYSTLTFSIIVDPMSPAPSGPTLARYLQIASDSAIVAPSSVSRRGSDPVIFFYLYSLLDVIASSAITISTVAPAILAVATHTWAKNSVVEAT